MRIKIPYPINYKPASKAAKTKISHSYNRCTVYIFSRTTGKHTFHCIYKSLTMQAVLHHLRQIPSAVRQKKHTPQTIFCRRILEMVIL